MELMIEWGNRQSRKNGALLFLADKDVYILVPRTHEYVTLGGKIDFTDRIKLKDSEMGRLSWLVWMGPNKVYES